MSKRHKTVIIVIAQYNGVRYLTLSQKEERVSKLVYNKRLIFRVLLYFIAVKADSYRLCLRFVQSRKPEQQNNDRRECSDEKENSRNFYSISGKFNAGRMRQ